MPQQIAHFNKRPMKYRFEGTGPTVMVLNGGHCSRDTRLSHERLTEHSFSVPTPTRPGYDSTPLYVGKSAQDAADALASLLDFLQIATVDVIGISAAGPTALTFVQRYPGRVRKRILESAVTTDWDEKSKRRSRIGFGRLSRLTWFIMHGLLRFFPSLIIKVFLHDLTVLDANLILRRMSPNDIAIIKRMLLTSRASTGFVADTEHKVKNLSTITRPILVMFSPNDATVSPKNAQRIAQEVPSRFVYEVPPDTHLIWIGPSSMDVWEKRLSFLLA